MLSIPNLNQIKLLTSQLDEQRKYWEAKLEEQNENKRNLEERNKFLEKQIEELREEFCTKRTFEKERQNMDRRVRQATERAVKSQIELEAEKEMTKNLMNSKMELDLKVKSHEQEIDELKGTVRDLMLHLEAAQSVGKNSVRLKFMDIIFLRFIKICLKGTC